MTTVPTLPGAQETGARPRRRPAPAGTWTRESVIKAFQAEVQKTGRLPSCRSWRCTTDQHPNHARVTQLFGRWNNLVLAAGFRPRTPVRTYELEWSDQEIIDHLQAWARRHGRVPAAAEWELTNSPDRPSMSTVRNRFGGWNAALKAAGLTPFVERGRQWTEQEALTVLRAEIQRTGRVPSSAEWVARSLRPTLKVCATLFGSWSAFIDAADLSSDLSYGKRSRWTKAAVFEELDNWIEAHGYVPTYGEWRYAEAGKPRFSVVRHMFGSWTAFLQEAGCLD